MFDCATVVTQIERQDIPADWQFLPVQRWYLAYRFLTNVVCFAIVESLFVFAGIGVAFQHFQAGIVVVVILLGIVGMIFRAFFPSLQATFTDCLHWRDEYIVFAPDGIFMSTRCLPKNTLCLSFEQTYTMDLVQVTNVVPMGRGGTVRVKAAELLVSYAAPTRKAPFKRKAVAIVIDNRFGNRKAVLQHCMTSFLNYKASQE